MGCHACDCKKFDRHQWKPEQCKNCFHTNADHSVSNDMDITETTVQVALRIRPLIDSEKEKGCVSVIHLPRKNQVSIGSVKGQTQAFTFDFVLSEKITQKEVYEQCVPRLMASYFKGYNATVIAYGQNSKWENIYNGYCK